MSLLYSNLYLLLSIVLLFNSCGGKTSSVNVDKKTTEKEIMEQSHPQISEYIRNIFQDKNGNFWMGTNGDGVAHYDGKGISYFSNAEDFDGRQITGITEDAENNIWFATDQGIVKYHWSSDPEGKKQFTNFNSQTSLGNQQFWSVLADSKNRIWAGSATGIFIFDGKMWTPFELPYPEKSTGDFIAKATSWSITEDQAGNIWFSTNGFGAFKYDGQSFTQITEANGLTDNSVDVILEDHNGNMWFGTRYGGVSMYDGTSFTNFTENDSIGNNEVCALYEDTKGNIWFSSEGYGVYCFNGKYFTNYSLDQGLKVKAVQTIAEDRLGRLWVGGGGGLYRFNGTSFLNVTRGGPWN
ncbi:MAG: two-component regulator propeller domain-containing protein [Saprospiraceae bacterium]|nr:two-component regulator propeller domain-containing protein [Saprospiraceae bacterium]